MVLRGQPQGAWIAFTLWMTCFPPKAPGTFCLLFFYGHNLEQNRATHVKEEATPQGTSDTAATPWGSASSFGATQRPDQVQVSTLSPGLPKPLSGSVLSTNLSLETVTPTSERTVTASLLQLGGRKQHGHTALDHSVPRPLGRGTVRNRRVLLKVFRPQSGGCFGLAGVHVSSK